ncbi:MAG TPA: hypothetical protein PK675_03195 [Clostridia bacterium]|nr:hypothetical protein [Clostridia bacterium]
MGYKTVYDKVIFIEGGDDNARILRHIKCDMSFVIGAQLKSLNDIKKKMCQEAAAYNANAVVNFTYGQRARLFAIDDVAFKGEGDLAILPQDVYMQYIDYIKQRDGK